jgi:transposase
MMCQGRVVIDINLREPSEMKVSMIGLDLAKSVFQVHGVDVAGAVVVRRKLKRAHLLGFFQGLEPCVVGLEACGSAHHWARALADLGHEVRMLSARDVKAYVRRNKTDAADAEAICEAASRPHLRRVPIKTVERQAVLSMHKARALLISQRTRTTNALRGHLAEYGVVEPPGVKGLEALLARVGSGALGAAPPFLATALQAMAATLDGLQAAIRKIEREILDWHRQERGSRRLADAPGFGPLVASAVRSHLGDPSVFRSGREFAASLGLTPRVQASGGKTRLGPISKRGDRYLRRLLVNGAQAWLTSPKAKSDPWIARLLATKPRGQVAVALANKMARMAWAMLAKDQPYRPRPAQAQAAQAAQAA